MTTNMTYCEACKRGEKVAHIHAQEEPPENKAPAALARFGSKAEVFNGTAKSTTGGLTKSDLVLNKRGKVVSKKASERARARYPGIKDRLANKRKKPHAPDSAALESAMAPAE